MLELIAAVIELCNVITQTYNCSLFNVFVRFQQVLEWKLDHDNGLQIRVLLFNEFLFYSQYLVGEIWEQKDFFFSDVKGKIRFIGTWNLVTMNQINVCFWAVLRRQEYFHDSLIIFFIFGLVYFGKLFSGNRVGLGRTTELRPVSNCSRFVIKQELIKLSRWDRHASVHSFV